MENEDFDFTSKVMLKLTAAGYLHGLQVTMKSGFITYMLPKWVHKLHLKLLVCLSPRWRDEALELINEFIEMHDKVLKDVKAMMKEYENKGDEK